MSEWKSLSHVLLFATPWVVAHQAPLPMEFSKQEYWSGLLFPSPGDLSNLWIEAWSPALQADSLPSEPPRSLSNKSKDQTSRVACCILWHHLMGRKPAAFMPLLVTSLLRYYNFFYIIFLYTCSLWSAYTQVSWTSNLGAQFKEHGAKTVLQKFLSPPTCNRILNSYHSELICLEAICLEEFIMWNKYEKVK